MAAFRLSCASCEALVTRLAATEKEAVDRGGCKFCGGQLRRIATGPTAVVMEVLDNGARVTRLERFADAERMTNERARNADPLAGTKHEKAPEDPKL